MVGLRDAFAPQLTRRRARGLRLHQKLTKAIRGFPLVIFLLSRRHLHAIEPPLRPSSGQRLIFVASWGVASSLSAPGVTVVPVVGGDLTFARASNREVRGRLFELYAMTLVRSGPNFGGKPARTVNQRPSCGRRTGRWT